jgi:4-hydroxy-tetrahydrodipicolinate reductase
MVKVIVAGAAGRMGKRVIHIIRQTRGMDLVGAFEHPEHPSVHKDAGEEAGVGNVGVRIEASPDVFSGKGDVLIDFTTPEATLKNLRVAVSSGLAMVIGTTGLKGDQLEEARSLAGKIRCVMAPNMSVGVNVMFKLAGEMAKLLGNEFDMEILEAHHRLKKDAPSGTAMQLARILAAGVGRDLEKVGIYERRGQIGARTDEEIGIQAWRGGDIVGEHTVLFAGIGERLELIHRAHNRDNFAKGGVRAARWVVEQPVGLYDMQDVLGLK